jgi:hypothetical protein
MPDTSRVEGVVFLMPVFGVFLLDWIVLIRLLPCLFGGGFLFGEFDPGSGRTLAACLTHASRTERPFRGYSSGERVSNTWVICPALRDKLGKLGLIPDRTTACMGCGGKLLRCGMGPRPISLLVG